MEIFGDYHLHTTASDGTSSITEQARAAIKAGLKEIAITDHSFRTLFTSMSHHKFDNQTEEISMLHTVDYFYIKIYHGVEVNLINKNGDMDIPADVMPRIELLSMGFHRWLEPPVWTDNLKYIITNGFGSERSREKLRTINTWAYLSAIERYPIDVLVHLQSRTLVDAVAVCEAAAKKDIFIELNEKHIEEIAPCIDDILATNVYFIMGSDAHSPRNTGKFNKVLDFIEKHNIPIDRIAGIGFAPVFKDKSGYIEKK